MFAPAQSAYFLFDALEFAGVIAFAISGALAAIKNRLDISAAMILAFIVGTGGGTIRDLLLHAPVFWFHQQYYIYVNLFIGAAVFYLAYRNRLNRRMNRKVVKLLLIFDALGLAAFTIDGTSRALLFHHSLVVSCMMGMVTAVGGGVLRDVLCNNIPAIFHQRLYATAALAGAVVYTVAITDHVNLALAMVLSIIVTLYLRFMAIYRRWRLPRIR